MKYSLTVKGFDSGLNELLHGVYYDPRHRRVVNPIKTKNDKICYEAIRFEAPSLRKVKKLKTPIVIHYKFYCKNKKRDRSNVLAAFTKSFEDALQQAGLLDNDGWNDVVNLTSDYAIDSKNPRVEIIIEEVTEEYFPIYFGKDDRN